MATGYWHLHDWDTLPERVYSQVFGSPCAPFRLLLFPRGNATFTAPRPTYISLYLDAPKAHTALNRPTQHATFDLVLKHPTNPALDLRKSACHSFSHQQWDWGFTHFCETRWLREQGFLQPPHTALTLLVDGHCVIPQTEMSSLEQFVELPLNSAASMLAPLYENELWCDITLRVAHSTTTTTATTTYIPTSGDTGGSVNGEQEDTQQQAAPSSSSSSSSSSQVVGNGGGANNTCHSSSSSSRQGVAKERLGPPPAPPLMKGSRQGQGQAGRLGPPGQLSGAAADAPACSAPACSSSRGAQQGGVLGAEGAGGPGAVFRCHRLVLAAASAPLKAMMGAAGSGMREAARQEVVLHDVEPEALCEGCVGALAGLLDHHPQLSLELYGEVRRSAPDSSPLCQVGQARYLSGHGLVKLAKRLLVLDTLPQLFYPPCPAVSPPPPLLSRQHQHEPPPD
ncbi:hypothetical protein QJQ45_018580 [Haematococcus lacustris]|nr:hypothetical protein QJQ45_018580 [Haematococcus lacustris]